jgi:hypothetical protein
MNRGIGSGVDRACGMIMIVYVQMTGSTSVAKSKARITAEFSAT